jgi:hypothetical protein
MRKPLSVLVALILFSLVGYLLYSGGVNLLDFSTGIALLSAGLAIAVLWWGLRPDIMRWLKKKPPVNQVAHGDDLLNKKLIEVYSPIHAMIVRVNKEIPRTTDLQLSSVGVWVNASLIDFNNISTVFNQHNDKLRNRDLEMWLEIEKEIKRGNGFFLGADRKKWFDELEAEYNRLKEHYRG